MWKNVEIICKNQMKIMKIIIMMMRISNNKITFILCLVNTQELKEVFFLLCIYAFIILPNKSSSSSFLLVMFYYILFYEKEMKPFSTTCAALEGFFFLFLVLWFCSFCCFFSTKNAHEKIRIKKIKKNIWENKIKEKYDKNKRKVILWF